MITTWRIVKAKRAANAFDGEGARLFGGRWNSPGLTAAYTAGSAALATLEVLVHLEKSTVLPAYVLIACSFDQSLVTSVDVETLPANWRSYPPPPELQMLGDQWLKERRSAVLKVPSTVIEGESNYLLNPHHPQFGSIRIGSPQLYQFDLRLLR